VKKRILVVEDDGSLLLVLRDTFLFEGFDVECAANGETALKLAAAFDPDLIILDVTLPDANGFELCRLLSHRGQSPTIFLTARGQKVDRIRGLQLGADDYLTKPFDLEELVARVRAVLRRTRGLVEQIRLGPLIIDFRTRRATNAGRTIQLTHREFELLQYLAERRDRIVYRDELLREVWGYPESPITRSVDHAVARLRKKIEPDPHHPLYIHTVHGDGYCLTYSPPNAN
jgi:DNA-binding response OmpR family regulator